MLLVWQARTLLSFAQGFMALAPDDLLAWSRGLVPTLAKLLDEPEGTHDLSSQLPKHGLRVGHVIGLVERLNKKTGGDWSRVFARCRVTDQDKLDGSPCMVERMACRARPPLLCGSLPYHAVNRPDSPGCPPTTLQTPLTHCLPWGDRVEVWAREDTSQA